MAGMTSWVPWTTPPFSSTTEEVSEEKGVHGGCLGKASESPLLEKTGFAGNNATQVGDEALCVFVVNCT